MELLKIDQGYCMTRSCRSVNMRRKLPSVYRMSKPQKKGAASFQKKTTRQKH